jgi:hypothetical protein
LANAWACPPVPILELTWSEDRTPGRQMRASLRSKRNQL